MSGEVVLSELRVADQKALKIKWLFGESAANDKLLAFLKSVQDNGWNVKMVSGKRLAVSGNNLPCLQTVRIHRDTMMRKQKPDVDAFHSSTSGLKCSKLCDYF